MTFSYGDDMAERVRLAVDGGYYSQEKIIEDLVELVEYDPDAEVYIAGLGVPLTEHMTRLVNGALARQNAAEASFPEVTDCDRLDSVFDQLAMSGILTGQDVGTTMSDVRDDMWEAVDQARRCGEPARGWVAFHRQDVDRVVDTGTLCIAYAALTDLDDDFRIIGTEVAEALRSAGFEVDWNGDPARRIELHGLAWQKRRR